MTGDICDIYFFESKDALAAFRQTELAKTFLPLTTRSMSGARSTNSSTRSGPNVAPQPLSRHSEGQRGHSPRADSDESRDMTGPRVTSG